MALSEFEYKVLHLTDHLDHLSGADLTIEVQAKLGWDVQQIFTRKAAEGDFVYALLKRGRAKG